MLEEEVSEPNLQCEQLSARSRGSRELAERIGRSRPGAQYGLVKWRSAGK